jgi:hypothetical protein
MAPIPSSTPPPAPVGSAGDVMWHNPVPTGANALMRSTPQTRGGSHRIDPAALEGLPPEFVQALFEIAELVDIDGDGTPDVAMVPLNQTGGNALLRGFGGQGQGRPGGTELSPPGHFPRSIPGA